MSKLILIDHSYHQKTGTTRFLKELLMRKFQVEVIWDHGWNGGVTPSADDLNARKADAIVFFQSLPQPRVLRALKCTNLTWVPMRDGLNFRSPELKRLAWSPLKTLNFCREAHEYFTGIGLISMCVQYWPPPARTMSKTRGRDPMLFFWPRHREINWLTLKSLLGGFRPSQIILRYATDPGHSVDGPGATDQREYNVTLLEGWMEHSVYLRHMASCDIFMAPRPREGIGFAMLEAMSHGLAVIAPDAPTMNEYIRVPANGWLYNSKAPGPLDFRSWLQRGEQARADVADGHARWLKQAEAVVDFIAEVPCTSPSWRWRILQRMGV
jgi:hypothetical protein